MKDLDPYIKNLTENPYFFGVRAQRSELKRRDAGFRTGLYPQILRNCLEKYSFGAIIIK